MGVPKLMSGPTPPRRLLGRPEAQDLAAARLPWVFGFMAFWVVLIFLRLIWLQGIEHRTYRERAERQHTTVVPIPPIRGEIRDRRGASLALSLKVESLFCRPPVFYPDYRGGRTEAERHWGQPDRAAAEKVAARLAPLLDRPRSRILEQLLRKRPFVWLERQMAPEKAAAVQALKLEGLGFLPESRRSYPRGALACQVIGFTNLDGLGQLGVERAFEGYLAGRPGELVAPQDARGRLLILQENYREIPVNGSTLQLTLDASIQHLVEVALEEAVRKHRPQTAYAVVVDPDTGEILAMAGTPSFDPNHPVSPRFRNRPESEFSAAEKAALQQELAQQRAARKVHPVEDAYEPGSTMKVFTAAMALEERKVRLGEAINCEGGRWGFSRDLTITDTHKNGVLTFEEVLWHSSNVGTAKMGLRLDPAVHYQYLRRFGFGEPTGLAFPGETAGRLPPPDRWSRTTQPTLTYGYGLSTSPLQILMAGCALANGGRLMEPHLISRIYNDQGVLLQEVKPKVRAQVVSEETSALMREALKGVITSGTARLAQLDGVEAFGKTGTARKIINGKYDPRKHYASFMGFFPADKPRFGVLVMLDEPAGGLTGGDVAAPIFKQIGDGILRYQAAGGEDATPDLKLTLRDWPSSETDEARVHVESGKVPDLSGLSVKAAVQRVVLAGGVPRVEGLGSRGEQPTRVEGQAPEPGAPLPDNRIVTLRVRTP